MVVDTIYPKPIERSTYVLCNNMALALLFYAWQPLETEFGTFKAPSGKACCMAFLRRIGINSHGHIPYQSF